MAFKMRGFSGFKQQTEGPVKPKSMMEAETEETWSHETITPGFEDPIKIQKLKREGLTPGSKKFSYKAGHLETELDKDAYENAINDFDTENPTKAQIAESKAKIKKERK
tara:strand:- start:36 stop:362 length:327 start_codon:yes stop_codon:yes gene_type:complete